MEPSTAIRSVAPWLGVLFALLFSLNSLGGWVRLSGSGVAIPQWPLVDGSLLPPLGEVAWLRVKASYDADQKRLNRKVEQGDLSHANRGRIPASLADFKTMFLIEWAHRLFAALVGVVTLACLTVVLRQAEVRRRAGGPLLAATGLILLQAVLGGMLVAHGTGTHFLFLHQGNAACIMACILIALLRLVDGPLPPLNILTARRGLGILAGVTLVATWGELVVGALVAGSRNGRPFRVFAPGEGFALWRHDAGLAWNLLDNTALHQWLHRFSGWGLVALLAVVYFFAWRQRHLCGPRTRLALMVSATFLPVQLLLGLANVEVGFTPLISLGHQFMGMCLFLSLVLVWHDVRHETLPDREVI